jgi:hypothetical protein
VRVRGFGRRRLDFALVQVFAERVVQAAEALLVEDAPPPAGPQTTIQTQRKESHHQHPGRARDIFPGVTGADTREWAVIADSAARLVRTAQALTDDDLHEASALPGWTRAHVLTHVAQGADSRTRLLRAAQAGRIGQQYPSEQARAEAIDAGARRPAGVIRADLERAIQECLTAIREHPSQLSGRSDGSGLNPASPGLPTIPPLG